MFHPLQAIFWLFALCIALASCKTTKGPDFVPPSSGTAAPSSGLILQLDGQSEALTLNPLPSHYRPSVLSLLTAVEALHWQNQGFAIVDFDVHDRLYTVVGSAAAPPPPACYLIALAPIPRLQRSILVTRHNLEAMSDLPNLRYCGEGTLTAANQESAGAFRHYIAEQAAGSSPSLSLTRGGMGNGKIPLGGGEQDAEIIGRDLAEHEGTPPHQQAEELHPRDIQLVFDGDEPAQITLDPEHYRQLIQATESAASATAWADVLDRLAALATTSGKDEKTFAAIERQALRFYERSATASPLTAVQQETLTTLRAKHSEQQAEKTADHDDGVLDKEVQDKDIIARTASRLKRLVMASATTPGIEERLSTYLRESRILALHPELAQAMEGGIRDYIAAKKRWPERDVLDMREQFYWNIMDNSSGRVFLDKEAFLRNIFGDYSSLKWADFLAFQPPFSVDRNDPRANKILQFLLFKDGDHGIKNTPAQIDAFRRYHFTPPEFFERCLQIPKKSRDMMDFSESALPKSPQEVELYFAMLAAFPEEKSSREAFAGFLKSFSEKKADSFDSIREAFSQDIPLMSALYRKFGAREEEIVSIFIDTADFIKYVEQYYKDVKFEGKRMISSKKDLNRAEIRICKNIAQFVVSSKKALDFKEFKEFFVWEPTIDSVGDSSPILSAEKKLSACLRVYERFPEAEERKRFVEWMQRSLLNYPSEYRAELYPGYIDIYLTYPHARDRQKIEQLLLLPLKDAGDAIPLIPVLDDFSAYADGLGWNFAEAVKSKSFITTFLDDERKEEFKIFWKYHQGSGLTFEPRDFASAFISREFLTSERKIAMISAVQTSHPDFKRALGETKMDQMLPPLNPHDRFMGVGNAHALMSVNVHLYESVYRRDFVLLKKRSDTLGYKGQKNGFSFTRYNSAEVIANFPSTDEVADFIRYLDEFTKTTGSIKIDGKNYTATQINALVKQILGLEPRTGAVQGVHEPYLGATMIYGDPRVGSIMGDEVLGRAWLVMKNLDAHEDPSGKADDYRRTLIHALVEAADIDPGLTQVNCQTRVTGELSKALSWHLEGSELRQLIAADEPILGTGDDAIKRRIARAPEIAQRIFKGLFAEGWNWYNPELFKVYRTFYDALYRRKSVVDAVSGVTSHPHDDQMLELDRDGNAVSPYAADGSPRADGPVLVYYQAEFLAIEHAFTSWLVKDFERQRGVLY